jgi:hypothetical protein
MNVFRIILFLSILALACSAIPLPGGAPGTDVPTIPTLPVSTNTPVPPADFGPLPQPGTRLALFRVAEDAAIALRAEPDAGAVLAELPLAVDMLTFLGGAQSVAGNLWLEVALSGQSGWLPGANLIERTSPDAFCSNPAVDLLVADVMAAFALEDGTALAALSSPTHGLFLRHNWWNPEVWIAPERISGLFRDATVIDWGLADGSGEPILGDFNTVLLPGLQEVVGVTNKSTHCNDLENGTGPTTGYTIPSAEYQNANYVVLYRPAGPQDNELDWRSFAFGIEIIDGQPYLLYIIMYRWEI